MFRVWNVVLISLTFFLTIFGTFLTRSGLIASVHSFATSNIGIYFVYFMILIVASTVGLLIWRWPLLRASAKIESLASREAAFVLNNWALLGGCSFIAIATVFPLISEALWDETVTVGPPFYNRWMAPIGLLILALMGVAPLFGWRKTSADALRKAFRFPTAAMLLMMLVHFLFGGALGYDAIVDAELSGDGWSDVVLAKFEAVAPLITVGLVAFNFAVVLQEFQRGVVARRKNAKEGIMEALVTLVARSRRRYGGYIVHIGVGFMFLGFVGKSWDLEQEATLTPGQSVEVGDYSLTYRNARMETDAEKRMVFADVEVSAGGRALGTYSPAQFIFIKAQMPTSEVSMVHRVKDDLYMVVGSINPTTKRATFRFHVNPLVSWIWLGVIIMIGGALISLWPQVSWRRLGVWGSIRLATGATAGIMFSVLVASTPGRATQIIPSRVLADHDALLSNTSHDTAIVTDSASKTR